MSHAKDSSGRFGTLQPSEQVADARTASEWEADTDVMPPEYCRQLIRISRQLQRER
jgi:hypothetical protein